MQHNQAIIDEEALQILKMLRTDFLAYAHRCLKIRTKNEGLQPFVLNAAQRYLHSRIESQLQRTGKVRIIIVKGRQQGCSTYCQGRFFWKVSGEFGKRAFILSHLAEATSNLFGMTKRYLEHVPKAVKPHTKTNSANTLYFDRLDSEYSVATAGSKGAGRSATAQYLHASEAAWWENAADHMAGIGQIVPNSPGTEIIIESTANGQGNLFHGMVMDAQEGRGEYELVFIPWFWQPEYSVEPPNDWVPDLYDGADYGAAFSLTPAQLYWREQKIITDFRGDIDLFNQEYPATVALAFARVEGTPLVPLYMVLAAMAPPPAREQPTGTIIMGIDPAEYGSDATAFALRQGRHLVHLERHQGLGPMEVVGLAAKRIDAWRPDVINIDCTGVGSGIADRLRETGYPVNRIHFGERAFEQAQYLNRRAEMWDEMKKWLEDKPAYLPNDDRLIADLTGPGYTYDSSRRLKLEQKEDMKKRGLKSPDSADAIALTFAVNTSAVPNMRPLSHSRRTHWRAV